jgi:cytochrome oxidase Cu insertion factor (SCO1/SenC/PrrC family)
VSPPSPEAIRRGRLKLLALAALFVAPFVLAWLAWRFEWASGNTSNYGELITPARPLAGAPLEALRGRWVLVTFDTAACDAYCERKLYFMRQIRRALNEDGERVARLWLLTDGERASPKLLAAIEGTHVARAGALAQRFPAEGALADHIYVVDPLGNLMMRYPRDPDPSRMLKDLQRLLRFVRLG